jgi:hypothetical protein
MTHLSKHAQGPIGILMRAVGAIGTTNAWIIATTEHGLSHGELLFSVDN